ncbi:DUF2569 domain-containing protein [Cohnella mopanensis]|uniref:DUF2569 domain-containing protein n=1 Tax=Cohnella mopanensis TaxID=2911966 RepID=UPI0034E29609
MENSSVEKNSETQKYLPLGISGLGGWLVLVQIGLYATLLLLFVQFFNTTIPAFSPDIWGVLTDKQSAVYDPLWAPALVYEALYNVLMFAFCIYCLINLYSKKTIFPRLMIIGYSSGLIFGIIDYVLITQIPLANELEDGSLMRSILRAALSCAIWIPYLLKSERVHNTFVR